MERPNILNAMSLSSWWWMNRMYLQVYCKVFLYLIVCTHYYICNYKILDFTFPLSIFLISCKSTVRFFQLLNSLDLSNITCLILLEKTHKSRLFEFKKWDEIPNTCKINRFLSMTAFIYSLRSCSKIQLLISLLKNRVQSSLKIM